MPPIAVRTGRVARAIEEIVAAVIGGDPALERRCGQANITPNTTSGKSTPPQNGLGMIVWRAGYE